MNINQDFSSMKDSQLIYAHHALHKQFNIWKKHGKAIDDSGYSWKKADFYNVHKILSSELKEQGYEHNTQDELDQLTMGECQTCQSTEPPERMEVGEVVTLEEVIKYMKPFSLINDAVALTGDITNKGRTNDKIDIYVPEGQNTSYIKYVLTEMFPKELHSRLNFIGESPDDSFIPLYNAVYELNDPIMKVNLTDVNLTIVQPMRYFKPLYPASGRKNTAFSPEKLKKIIREYPVCLQEKPEGVRCQIHKYASIIKVLTVSGVDIKHRLPTLVKTLSADEYSEFVLDAYITHENGEEVAFLSGTEELVEGEDKKLNIIVSDVLSWKGEDMHYRTFEHRRKVLETIPTAGYAIVQGHQANDEQEMLLKLKNLKADEVIVREFSSTYPLNGTTTRWYTYKKKAEYLAMVSKKKEEEDGLFTYQLSVMPHEEHEVDPIDGFIYRGKKYVFAGRSAGTRMNFEEGSIARINSCKAIRYKGRVRLFEAEIVGLANESPYDMDELVKVAEDSKSLQEVIGVGVDMELPEDKVYNYVVQAHFRGKSMHHDLRVENGSGDLESFAIFSKAAGKIKMQPKNAQEAKRLHQALTYSWPKSDDRAFIGYVESTPDVFLEQKGDMEPVGDMKDLPGFLWKVDRGTMEYGAQLSGIREFFPSGPLFGGNRLMMFYLERTPINESREEELSYKCQCIKCKHEMESDRHCKDIKCPECGGQMRRKGRPGPGQNEQMSEKELESKYGRKLAKEEEALEFNDKAWTRTLPGIDESKSEYRFRVKNPGSFVRGSFRAKDWGNGIYAIYAKSKSTGKMQVQSIRFRKSAGWTKAKVRSWLKSHGYLEKKNELSMDSSDILALFRAIEDAMVPKDIYGFSGYSEEQMRDEKGFWMTWLPTDQTPYVLSEHAVMLDWIPSKGISALPKRMRDKVPEKYQYWNFTTRSKRMKVRNEYVKALKTKFYVLQKYDNKSFLVEREGCNYLAVTYDEHDITEDADEELSYAQMSLLQKVDGNRKTYSLIRHWWKGKKATKLTQHWDLHIGDDMYVLIGNPARGNTRAAQRKPYGKGYSEKGKDGPEFIKPGSPGNKTKSTPAWMERQDAGHVEVVVDNELYKQINFFGVHLKGTYALKRESKDVNNWSFEKVEVSTLSRKLGSGESIVKAKITLSVNDFGVKTDGKFHVSGAAFSHGVWNGEYYSPEVIRDRPERVLGMPVCVGPHEKVENDGSVVDMKFAEDTIFIDTTVETESGQRDVEDGEYVGFSVEVTVLVDEVRRVIKKILSYDRVNIVKNPACEVCTIDHISRP